MKKFKFRYSKLTVALIYIGLALSVAAFAMNTFYVITDGIKTALNPFYPILRYSLMYFISVLLCVVLVSLLISSYYAVDKKYLKTCFGIVRSKYDVTKIETILIDRNTDKLSVFFDNNSFITIAINEEWYDEFSDALLAANPKIEFSIASKDGDKKDNDKK